MEEVAVGKKKITHLRTDLFCLLTGANETEGTLLVGERSCRATGCGAAGRFEAANLGPEMLYTMLPIGGRIVPTVDLGM